MPEWVEAVGEYRVDIGIPVRDVVLSRDLDHANVHDLCSSRSEVDFENEKD
ncbi:hypothetical protein QJS04_geneDACA013352 [Acorus gramineus]|uniref:Uncharacterized protein n=1 Tax=Acorus gramineus TaxID=55184 RepID=A0AAV9A9L3_ACOGR|nr:hypothetical protein QJS04_geneDACA013352 [Acorus gramineus]